jgi:hypothetical protein
MCHPRTKFLLVILFVLGSVTVFAQTGTVSDPTSGRENNPYSKYGIGELTNGNNAVLRGMGNITSTYEDPYRVNSDNPASYAFLQRTVFEAGMTASTRTVSGSGLSYTTGTATLAYLNIGVPVGKHGGFCMGFRPYSSTYYSMVDTINAGTGSPIGQAVKNYNGDGSTNFAYLGGAYKYKGLSIGVNVGYMFGTIRQSTVVAPIDTQVTNRAYTADFANYTRIGGLYWKAGLMYERKLDSNYTIHAGGTIAMTQSLTERLSAFQISTYNFGDTIVNDTTSNPGQQRGKLTLPTTYSIGFMLSKRDKWMIGIDYTATQWNQFKSTLDSTITIGVGSSSYKVSIGGAFTPDANNIRNYFSRVTYRLGAYYGQDYLDINNTKVPVYGVTAGMSLPFRRSISAMHLALDIGHIGVSSLIEETYVRFTLGFSFNDKWFVQRRYE